LRLNTTAYDHNYQQGSKTERWPHTVDQEQVSCSKAQMAMGKAKFGSSAGLNDSFLASVVVSSEQH
jgi:hypothetical protein